MSDTPKAPPVGPLKMGQVLVLCHAAGHRLQEIMGPHAFRFEVHTLQAAGLLDENGEPTPEGFKLADQIIAKQRTVGNPAVPPPEPTVAQQVETAAPPPADPSQN